MHGCKFELIVCIPKLYSCIFQADFPSLRAVGACEPLLEKQNITKQKTLCGVRASELLRCTKFDEDDDDDDDDDGDGNKISLFTLDIVLAHSQVSAFELSFHGVPLIKGCSLYQSVSYIGVLFAGVFFFLLFLMNSSLYRDVHYLGSR